MGHAHTVGEQLSDKRLSLYRSTTYAITLTNLNTWPECANQGLQSYIHNSLSTPTIGLRRRRKDTDLAVTLISEGTYNLEKDRNRLIEHSISHSEKKQANPAFLLHAYSKFTFLCYG